MLHTASYHFLPPRDSHKDSAVHSLSALVYRSHEMKQNPLNNTLILYVLLYLRARWAAGHETQA